MAVLTELLQALGLIEQPSTAPGDPAKGLTLSWPPDPTPLAQGPVTSTSGALDRATSPHPRVVAFVAPETTLRGLGQTVTAWLRTISAPAQPIPDALSVTHAIMAYNQDVLGIDRAIAVQSGAVPGPLLVFPAWEVGRGVRLPVERDAAGRCTTDAALWVTHAAHAAPVAAAWNALIDLTPTPLAIPDRTADAATAAALIAAHPHLADAADELRTDLLTNPSKALYEFMAVWAASDPAAGGEQTSLLTALVTTALSADELELLATTMPGAAVLRAMYRRLAAAATPAGHAASVDTAVAALNTALKITGATAVDLSSTTPGAVARELPVSPAWTTRPDVAKKPPTDSNGERLDGRHVVVMGRAIYGGVVATEGRCSGPAYVGTGPYETSTYVRNHPEVAAGADARRLARLNVVEQIGPNEAYLDGVRLRDLAIMSVGVQQWSVHVDNEFDPWLWTLSQEHPDDYDVHFGSYGLRLSLTATWPAGTPGFPPGAPRAASQSKAVPGGANVAMPAPQDKHPESPPDRVIFFGGTVGPQLPPQFRYDDTPWAGRVRSAVLCSFAVRMLAIDTAIARFDRIRAEVGPWQVGGQNRTIDELITSTQGAAQLLDVHINAPGHVNDDVRTAIQHTSVTPVVDANGITDDWLTAFETQYLLRCRYLASVCKTSFVDAQGRFNRGRQTYIVSKGMSTNPHSFDEGW